MRTTKQRGGMSLVIGTMLVMTAGTGSMAHAQWVWYDLTPAGKSGSFGEDTLAGTHVGSVRVGADCSEPHAAVWTGTSTDWVDLHPPGSGSNSYINGTTGTRHAGSFLPSGLSYHAALWTGLSSTPVDLQPTGASESNAYDIADVAGTGLTQQVGSVKAGTPPHAALWHETPESHIDLNPAGSQFSVALGTNGQRQVGYMLYDYIYGDSHAALWSGTPESFVDLHPADGVENSYAVGISPDGEQQVGSVEVQVGSYMDAHAAVWHGRAEPWIDLNPPGSIFSEARATDGVHQAGQAYAGEGTYYTYRAYAWAGSVEKRVDLHALLPTQYTMSATEGIHTDRDGIWVFGYAHRTGVQCNRAILWHLAFDTPGDCDGDDDVDLDDFGRSQACLSDPDTAVPPVCLCADLDIDTDVDLADFALFQALFMGP